ncbi:MAG: nicotinate phosphoribosyltransferase [Methanomicrobiales archaeon]|nr:nicotinate phosphoribosyltransferase [Methanomicrobiales archaeon]
MERFGIVDEKTIREGRCTDIYFLRTEEVLKKEGLDPLVSMEVSTTNLPSGWGVFCGLDDVISVFEGVPVTVHAMPEGSIFYPYEPVLRITGHYCDLCRYETSVLGFLCHASGIATAAAIVKQAAGERMVYSFGSRRQHPALASMIERSAWIGGVDGVSNICAPEGVPLVGTMPHSFIICHHSVEDAFRAFDRHAPAEVPRIMLCDTHCDERQEALLAARTGAEGVRLDTPRSRRGDMRAILEEVRWELDLEGYGDVLILLSGGVTVEDILDYRDIVYAFGVGGAIANAPVVDFALDIVEIDGFAYAKRGKRGGEKQVYELPDGGHLLLPLGAAAPHEGIPMLECFIQEGNVRRRSDLSEARRRVMTYLGRRRKGPEDDVEKS